MGPNSDDQLLNVTSDIGARTSPSGPEVTSGDLYWADGQPGVQTISVIVKPFSPGVWHVEKRYHVNICSIRSSSSLMDAGQISPTAGTVTLIVCTVLTIECKNLFTLYFVSKVS